MLLEVVITDVTRMVEQRVCVAGYLIGGNGPFACVRPELKFQPLVEPWLWVRAVPVVRQLAVVELNFLPIRVGRCNAGFRTSHTDTDLSEVAF